MDYAIKIALLVSLVVLYFVLTRFSDLKVKHRQLGVAFDNKVHLVEIWKDGFSRLRQDKVALLSENRQDRDDLVHAHEDLRLCKEAVEVLGALLKSAVFELLSKHNELTEANEDFHESVEDMDNLISTLKSGGVSVSWEQGQDGTIIPHLDFSEHDKVASKQLGLAAAPALFRDLPKPPLSGGTFEPVIKQGLYRVGDCVVCGFPKSECIGYRLGCGFKAITAPRVNPEAKAKRFNDGDQSGTAA